MSEPSIDQRVGALLVGQLGLDKPPSPGDRLQEDLDADSLDSLELEIALIDEFGIEFEVGALDKMKTVEEITAFINNAVAS